MPQISDAQLKEIAERLCRRVDWQRQELSETSFAEAYRKGASLDAARGLVRHLRQRQHPIIGVSQEYLRLLRANATPEMRKQARARLDQDIDQKHSAKGGPGNRGTVVTSFSAEDLHLAATENDLLRIGEILAAQKDGWGQNGWGMTCHICNAISRYWPLEQCPDDTFIPFLELLLTQIEPEWSWAKTWNETMLGNSGHNWWLTTFGGFWMAGLMFPEFKGLEQFRAFAPEWLEREGRMLFEPDGFTKERSGYHWGTAEELYHLAKLAERNGIKFSPAHQQLLRNIAEINWKLVSPDGDLPCVGDTGAGRNPGWMLRRIRIEAARHGLPQSKWVAEKLGGGWQPPAAWNDGYTHQMAMNGGTEMLAQRYLELAASQPAELDTALPHSGYYCIRSAWEPKADYACIDAGARGNIVSSHDHTAIFHIALHSKGRAILVDNYSGHYGDNPERMYRVSSRAHNVATVDGEDQLPMNGEWRWHMPVTPYVNDWISHKKYAYFNGAHEGYARLQNAVPSSRRKLFYLRDRYWILIDRFTAAAENLDKPHTYRQYFHTPVAAALQPDGRLATSGEGGNLVVMPVEGARGEASFIPHPFPLEGYENPAELCYAQESKGHGLFVTLLVPFENSGQPKLSVELLPVEADNRIVSPWEITALAITLDGERHLYVDQHMEWNLPWSADGRKGQSRLYHSELA